MPETGPVIELVRVTARVSLFLYCIAFAAEHHLRDATLKRLGFLLFYLAHLIHLALVAFYFHGLGEWPLLTPSLALLILGVLVLVWIGVALLSSYEESGRQTIAPRFMLWYLWFLFGATHVSRLADPERAAALNWIFLAIVLLAGVLRVRARRDLPKIANDS